MKKSLLSALLITGVAGAALAQQAAPPPATAHTAADQMRGAAPAPAAITPPVPPPRRLAPPVPALLQSRAHEVWTTNCVACHGNTLEKASATNLFTDAYLSSHTDAQIASAVADGPAGVANHGFKTLYLPGELGQIPAYLRIRGGVLNRKVGDTPDPSGKVIKSQKATFKVETLAKGFNQPWGLGFLPDGRMIFTERSGQLRFLDKNGKVSAPVKGTPKVFERQDGGMLDVALPPDFAKSGWIYLSYSDVPPGFTPEPGTEIWISHSSSRPL